MYDATVGAQKMVPDVNIHPAESTPKPKRYPVRGEYKSGKIDSYAEDVLGMTSMQHTAR